MTEGSRPIDSWKQIAAFFRRDVRTVSRWEKERGLPVHRIPGGKRGAVYAHRAELEAWLRQQPPELLRPNMPVTADRRRFWAALIGLLLTVVLVTALYSVYSAGAHRVARAALSGKKLLAWDEQGRLRWGYDFRETVEAASFDEPAPAIRLADLDGDGRDEILVMSAFPREGTGEMARHELLCFSARGELLWRYNPQRTLTFGGRRWEGPWHFDAWMVTAEGNSKYIWAAASQSPWWPAFLVRIDHRGQAEVRFVNSGVIYALNHVRASSGAYILAGGVNNEYDSGALAVLRQDQAPAASPQNPGSGFLCADCPPGSPYRYFVFPRSELNRLLGLAYNRVKSIRMQNGRTQIEAYEASSPGYASSSFYELANDFEPERAVLSDGYWQLHAKLESERKLPHTAAECPERVGRRPVRVWAPERGWSETRVPAALNARVAR